MGIQTEQLYEPVLNAELSEQWERTNVDQSQTEYNVPSLPRDLYTIYILKKISKELPGIATNDSYTYAKVYLIAYREVGGPG